MITQINIDHQVVVHEQNLPDPSSINESIIFDCLLRQLKQLKASRQGYYVAITRLNTIGRGFQHTWSEKIIFPVNFKCRFFKPVVEEILNGVVRFVTPQGVYLKHGPMKRVFLSNHNMRNYNYVPGVEPAFVKQDGSRIEKGVVVRFKVGYVRWMGDLWREFKVLATLYGDGLGPVSLTGEDDELEL